VRTFVQRQGGWGGVEKVNYSLDKELLLFQVPLTAAVVDEESFADFLG